MILQALTGYKNNPATQRTDHNFNFFFQIDRVSTYQTPAWLEDINTCSLGRPNEIPRKVEKNYEAGHAWQVKEDPIFQARIFLAVTHYKQNDRLAPAIFSPNFKCFS